MAKALMMLVNSRCVTEDLICRVGIIIVPLYRVVLQLVNRLKELGWCLVHSEGSATARTHYYIGIRLEKGMG